MSIPKVGDIRVLKNSFHKKVVLDTRFLETWHGVPRVYVMWEDGSETLETWADIVEDTVDIKEFLGDESHVSN